MVKSIALVYLFFINNILYSQSHFRSNKSSIFIELKSDIESTMNDSASLVIQSIPNKTSPLSVETEMKALKREMRWVIDVKTPVSVSINGLKPDNGFFYWLLEPGDSIIVEYNDRTLLFRGKGSAKLNLWNDLKTAAEGIKKPSSPSSFVTKSITDYLEYHTYLSNQWVSMSSILQNYKGKVTDYAYDYIKSSSISQLEYNRWNKFFMLNSHRKGDAFSRITSKELCGIYDSTFFSPSASWMRKQPFSFVAEFNFMRSQIQRKYNFSETYNEKDHLVEILEEGKKQFNGWLRDYFLYRTLTILIVRGFDITSETDSVLDKYSAEIKLSSYKKNYKDYVKRRVTASAGGWGPLLNLIDLEGRSYNNKNLLGKLVLLHFWNKADRQTKAMYSSLKKIKNDLGNDTSLVVFNVFTGNDKDAWHNQLKEIKTEDPLKTNVIIDGKYILKGYDFEKYPAIYLIDHNGRLSKTRVPDPVTQERYLTRVLRETLANIKTLKNDGPYVIYENEDAIVYSFSEGKPLANRVNKNQLDSLFITDEIGMKISVYPKNINNIEPNVFNKPEKLIALSDIEGNFDVLSKLLKANKVIDDQYNWIYGKGHLVFVGDMFDRGNQVTECLWLIYALEDKAKSAGGYVHFILGNHEIMNLSGNLKYVQKKYKDNAELFQADYAKILYGQNSELGRWLRTKNIVEKIGDILFLHAGISEEVNNLNLPISEINELARPYYDKDSIARKSSDKQLSLLYNTKLSPFWYRMYYQEDSMRVGIGYNRLYTTYKTSISVINSILETYKVNHIVTGHTIPKLKEIDKKYGQVSVHFENKVINTDTPHAKGFNEALLIEGDKYYRVNAEGKKVLLFVDDKRKTGN
jgi:hypothetical protein